jgi:hypothetical protein
VLIINVKITQADQAMYRAKAAGRNCKVIFHLPDKKDKESVPKIEEPYGTSNLYLPNLLQVDILRPMMNSACAHNHHAHHHLLPKRPEFFART